MEKPKRAGVREVAKLAGVSVATVSRALNTPNKVSDTTVERVRKAADHLNFIPNSSARALSSSRTRSIGIVIPTLENLTFAKFIDALESALSAKDYNLVVSTTQKGKIPESEKIRRLVNIGVEALILPGASHSKESIDYLKKLSIPCIYSSIYSQSPSSTTIGYDNYNLAKELARHLIDLGHERIAILSGQIDNNDRAHLRYQGARAEIDKLTSSDSRLDRFVDISTSAAHQAVTLLYDHEKACLRNNITALLCLSDVLAIGALFSLEKLGLHVPDDVSVVGFDNIEMSEFTNPPLTTIDLPVHDMGTKIADEIIAHLETGKAINSQLLEAQLIIRESSGPAC
ncbi:HTH-type transcriptional repressor CytR [Halomonas sp. THAF5a]|uniref:LacI family DNA-binding transcriptional regulator n=1 Tax=Halomonas sp. THAF5a TaxID=2587844 RepID=UPI0012688F13|nr:LacI family DNA-binding transcriptional regulator [Halomonas sp. THAF5a]QFU02312.1 HTH-type transcriptional repressor CytR [Halomonas sp. THAF5a]